MMVDPSKHHRRSIRMKGYDYSSEGAYFVTLCARGHRCLFGKVMGHKMQLNDVGQMVGDWWNKIPEKFAETGTDYSVIMPNHFHGIIVFVGADPRVCPGGQGGRMGPPLPAIVQWFKTMTTNEYIRRSKASESVSLRGRLWQRNYWEHIIRNEDQLFHIREYIVNNPVGWAMDRENPHREAVDPAENDPIFGPSLTPAANPAK